tara:strand:- start:1957 stop:2196 length:240 start_codon:yes stop_codon:yes gene_type:complete
MSEICINVLIALPLVLLYYCTYLGYSKHQKNNESKQPQKKAKQNYVLGDVSERVLPPWVRPSIMVFGVLAIIAFIFNVC